MNQYLRLLSNLCVIVTPHREHQMYIQGADPTITMLLKAGRWRRCSRVQSYKVYDGRTYSI